MGLTTAKDEPARRRDEYLVDRLDRLLRPGPRPECRGYCGQRVVLDGRGVPEEIEQSVALLGSLAK
ncbi:hypothetical protein [Streptomyces sp. NPDC002403]